MKLTRALVGVVVLVVSLGAWAGTTWADSPPSADALRSYIKKVEPIRLGVNKLLEGADPILQAYQDGTLDAHQAATAMGGLERRFADYTLQVHALAPSNATLAKIHAPFAHAFILGDAYLNALVAGLRARKLDNLPDTQARERAAIIEWRIRLEILARRAGVKLPRDLQQAGRGEIAPSPPEAGAATG